MSLLELLAMLKELIQSLTGWVGVLEWTINALLDLFLHGGFSGTASVLAYWLMSSATHWVLNGLVFRQHSRISWQGVLEPDIWRFLFVSFLLGSWCSHIWFDGYLW